KWYAKYDRFLHHYLFLKLNEFNRQNAESHVESPLEGTLFSIEGWVPVNKVDLLGQIVDDTHVLYEEVAILPTDNIPTCLDNDGLARVGEDLVHIYDTPSTTDKDPSLWVLCAFTLFFSLIVGDGGYGLILFGIVCYLWYKYPHIQNG